MRIAVGLTLLALTAGRAAGQAAPGRGDTLRFSQITKGSGEIQMPTGSQQMTSEMRMHTVLAFLSADSAVTWMDSVNVTTEPPSPMSTAMSQFTGRRVPMQFLPDGSVKFADRGLEGLGVTFSSSGQWGFAISLRQDLRPGATWTDTAKIKSGTQGVSMEMTIITRYRVVGDSVYESMPVTVLATATSVISETAGSAGAASLQATTRGEGTGRSYYSRPLRLVVLSTASLETESVTQVGDNSITARNRAQTTLRLLR
ncbi:MAG: hypothetical protein ACRENP_11405 [Longimicrobiales bacterium]